MNETTGEERMSNWYIGRNWLITAVIALVALAIPTVPANWFWRAPSIAIGDPGVFHVGQRVKSSRQWKEIPKGAGGTIIATPISEDACSKSRYWVAFDNFGKWCEYFGDIEPE